MPESKSSAVARVTELLQAVAAGREEARVQLMDLVYDDLRALARAKMARERPGNTLQPTALVHEAYLRLFGGSECRFENRRHFFGAAAEAMRRILIERARRIRLRRCELDMAAHPQSDEHVELLALDEAIGRLGERDPRAVEIVKLRYFAGLATQEIAEVLGISERTVRADWAMAKAWLRRDLEAKN